MRAINRVTKNPCIQETEHMYTQYLVKLLMITLMQHTQTEFNHINKSYGILK